VRQRLDDATYRFPHERMGVSFAWGRDELELLGREKQTEASK